MRNAWLVAGAAVMASGIPFFGTVAEAGTAQGSPPPTAETMHARYPDQNPGANPDNPASYPFLPPGQVVPHLAGRTANPQPVGEDLALNRPYTISAQIPDSYWHNMEQSNYPDQGQLTNGKMASLNFKDPQWVGLSRQYVHDITVDLGQVENIKGCSLDFLQDLGAGIVFPDSVTYYVSQDGKNWAPVGAVPSSQGAGDFTPQTQAFERSGINVNARYVRAEFTNKIWGFIDQFEVYGNPTPDPRAETPHGHPTVTWQTGYLRASSPATGGIHNMLLCYTDGYGPLGTWQVSDFLPMVANEDASGHARGPMYDGFLFSNYSLSTSKDAWNSWLKDLFSPGVQLSALDQAVSQYKAQWKKEQSARLPGLLPDGKVKVVVTIPTIQDTSNFGPVGNDSSLDLNPQDVGQQKALKNKLKAVQWYIQQTMRDFQQAKFQNLELAGFYWQPESLNVTKPDDAALVKGTSALVHQAWMRFYWIPFYGAVGLTEWRKLGFDAVMVQPNVSFNWDMPPGPRFESVAQFAKTYGTGFEIEAHWDVMSSDTSLAQTAQNRYFDYFTAGHLLGFEDNVMNSYYENSKTLVTAYDDQTPFYHRVYDDTNQFIDRLWDGTQYTQ